MSDQEILNALQGIHFGLEALRERAGCRGGNVSVWLHYLAGHYRQLPKEVARRLTTIDPVVINLLDAEGFVSDEKLTGAVERMVSPAAIAQVIRAVNIYRALLGLPQLGPDGLPMGV